LKVVLTVPHAISEKPDVEHFRDLLAPGFANLLHENLPNSVLVMGDENREDVDLNREVARPTHFREEIREVLNDDDILIDVHSFNEIAETRTPYDIVLLYHPSHSDLSFHKHLLNGLKEDGFRASVFWNEYGCDIINEFPDNTSVLVEVNEQIDNIQDLSESLSNAISLWLRQPDDVFLKENPRGPNFARTIRISKLQDKHSMVGQAFSPYRNEYERKEPWLGSYWFNVGNFDSEDDMENERRKYKEKLEKEEDERLEKLMRERLDWHIGIIGLASEARKYDTYEKFEKAYTREIKHGIYYHITDDPNFYIDSEKGPRDMSSMSTGKVEKGKLMITSDLDYWLAEYYDEREQPREYVALIDMSNVDKDDYYQVNRGFGNEFFVDDPSKAKVISVISVDRAKRIYEQWNKNKPQSKEELEKFYYKHGTNPLKRNPLLKLVTSKNNPYVKDIKMGEMQIIKYSYPEDNVDDYYYHGTFYERLPEIQKRGLDPFYSSKNWDISENKVYATTNPASAIGWIIPTLWFDDDYDDEFEYPIVVLRIHRDKYDWEYDRKGSELKDIPGGSFSTTQHIDTSDIDILTEEGWKPIDSFILSSQSPKIFEESKENPDHGSKKGVVEILEKNRIRENNYDYNEYFSEFSEGVDILSNKYKKYWWPITGMGLYDGWIRRPDYAKDAKGVIWSIEEMTPKEYFDYCYNFIFNEDKDDVSVRDKLMRSISEPNMEKLKSVWEKGDKLPLVMLDLREGKLNQEGRHRALLAERMGMEKIPVIVFRDYQLKNPPLKLYHGAHTNFELHEGQCFTDSIKNAFVFSGEKGEVCEILLPDDVVIKEDVPYNHDENLHPSDFKEYREKKRDEGIDILMYEDEDELGDRFTTYRVVNPRILPRIRIKRIIKQNGDNMDECKRTVYDWDHPNKIKEIEVPQHDYAWSGKIPMSGTYRCVHCGKEGDYWKNNPSDGFSEKFNLAPTISQNRLIDTYIKAVHYILVTRGNEQLYVIRIGDDGGVYEVLNGSGSRRVEISDIGPHDAKGCISIHGHPGPKTFSKSDLENIWKFGIKQSIIVHKDNTIEMIDTSNSSPIDDFYKKLIDYQQTELSLDEFIKKVGWKYLKIKVGNDFFHRTFRNPPNSFNRLDIEKLRSKINELSERDIAKLRMSEFIYYYDNIFRNYKKDEWEREEYDKLGSLKDSLYYVKDMLEPSEINEYEKIIDDFTTAYFFGNKYEMDKNVDRLIIFRKSIENNKNHRDRDNPSQNIFNVEITPDKIEKNNAIITQSLFNYNLSKIRRR